MIITVLSCNSESIDQPIESNIEVVPQTFLQKVNGLGFYITRGSWDSYVFFSDNKTFLYGANINSQTGETECYSLREGSNISEGIVNLKILNHTEKGLLIEIKWSSSNNSSKYEFSLNDTENFLVYREDFGDPDDVEWYQRTDREYKDFCSN